MIAAFIVTGIAAVAFAALWLDERLTRKTVQRHAEYLNKQVETYQRLWDEGAVHVPFKDL